MPNIVEEMLQAGFRPQGQTQEQPPTQGGYPSIVQEALDAGFSTTSNGPPSTAQSPLNIPQFESSADRLKYYNINPETANEVDPNKPPGFVQSVAQDLAWPFLKAYTTGAGAIEGATALARGNQQAAEQALQPRDFGYFGKNISPVGANIKAEGLQKDLPEIGRAAQDAVSVGSQLAPYFMGSVAPNGAGLAPKVVAGAKTGGAVGGVSSFGRALKDDVKGISGIGRVVGDTLLGVGTGAAVGAAVPVVTAGLRKLQSALTGVPDKTLARAYSDPKSVEYGRKILGENEKEPYYQLAQKLGGKLTRDKAEADVALKSAASQFAKANPGTKFSLRQDVANVLEPLQDFGLSARQQGGKIIIAPDGPSIFSPKEIKGLQSWIDELQSAKALTAEQLLRMPRVFSRYYQSVPYSDTGPTAFHAAMMKMKAPLEKIIERVVPDELSSAYGLQRGYFEAMEDFGTKILDPHGGIKTGAESFIGSLTNANKGELRSRVGPELLSRVQGIKDAQALNNLFASTGSRTQDVIRSLGVTALGMGAGGPVGGLLGLTATSPLVAGKIATGIGNAAQKGFTAPIKAAITSGLSGKLNEQAKALLKRFQ